MIIMLGQGMLYHIHHNRQEMLTKAERRTVLVTCAVTLGITAGVILWLLH